MPDVGYYVKILTKSQTLDHYSVLTTELPLYIFRFGQFFECIIGISHWVREITRFSKTERRRLYVSKVCLFAASRLIY